MTVTMFTICLLSLCSFQVITVSGTSISTSNEDIEKVRLFLSVAEAVKAVERAGGPRKMLKDPRAKNLPAHILEILHGLVKIEEKSQDTSQEISPRFFGSLMKTGVQFLFRAFNNLVLPAIAEFSASDTPPDPEMQL